MLPLALKLGATALGGLGVFKMVGKLFGNDPDFTMAWQLRMMSGQGGFSSFMSAFFKDGIGKMMWGSRTASAAMSRGAYGGAMAMVPYAHMHAMSPLMMNPALMGGLPYSPLGMGASLWV